MLGVGRTDEEYLAGGASPLSGYSSGEDSPFQRFSRSESGTSPEFVSPLCLLEARCVPKRCGRDVDRA